MVSEPLELRGRTPAPIWSTGPTLAALVLTGAAGCNIIAGFPDYIIDDSSSVSGGMGTGATGPGGAGAMAGQGGSGNEGAVGGGGTGGQPSCLIPSDCDSPQVCRAGTCELLTEWVVPLLEAGKWIRNTSAAATTDGSVFVSAADDYLGGTALLQHYNGSDGTIASTPIVGGSAMLTSVSADPLGRVFATGGAQNFTFPDTSMQTATSGDIVFVQYANAAQYGCGQLLGAQETQQGALVASNGAQAFLAGVFETSMNVGSGLVTSAGFADAVFLVSYDPADDCVFQDVPAVVRSDGNDNVTGLVVGSDGDARIVGMAGQTMDLGNGPLASGVFVAKYAPGAANASWSHSFGTGGTAMAHRAAIDDAGTLVLAGVLTGATDVLGQEHAPVDRALHIAKIDSAGQLIVSKTFPCNGVNVTGLTMGGSGEIILAGNLAASGGDAFVELVDGSPLSHSAAAADIFVAVLSSNLEHVLSQRFGGSGVDVATDLSYDPVHQNMLVTGAYGSANLDFGLAPLPAPQAPGGETKAQGGFTLSLRR